MWSLTSPVRNWGSCDQEWEVEMKEFLSQGERTEVGNPASLKGSEQRHYAYSEKAEHTLHAAEGGARELRHKEAAPEFTHCAASQKKCVYTCVLVFLGTKPVGCVLERPGCTNSSLRGMGTMDHGPGVMVSHPASRYQILPGREGFRFVVIMP